MFGKTHTGFLAQCRRDNFFPDRILWTDEATFTPNGVFNSHNFVFWVEENPHAIRECRFQYRWTINVWAGILENRIISNKLILIISKLKKSFFVLIIFIIFFAIFSDRSLFSTASSKWRNI